MRLLSALVVSLATTSVAAARATTNPHHKMSNNQQPLDALKMPECKDLSKMTQEEILKIVQAHVDSIPGGMKSVKPGMMSFDDHHFKINYDVPEEVTEELLDLMHRNAKYEEVPKEYLKYEVEKPREPDMLKDTHAKEKGMGLGS
jgi:hypothetical protein